LGCKKVAAASIEANTAIRINRPTIRFLCRKIFTKLSAIIKPAGWQQSSQVVVFQLQKQQYIYSNIARKHTEKLNLKPYGSLVSSTPRSTSLPVNSYNIVLPRCSFVTVMPPLQKQPDNTGNTGHGQAFFRQSALQNTHDGSSRKAACCLAGRREKGSQCVGKLP
jgi:hypothetical protein